MGLSRRDRSFLDLALRVAEASPCKMKHAAIIVKSGRVLSIGINSMRNDPAIIESDSAPGMRGTIFSYHAEISALNRLKDARGAVIYVARLGKDGREAMSRPCENCAPVLINSGIKSFVYTINGS